MKLDAKQLRVSEPTEVQLKKIKRRPIYIICDNILDTYNIGSIFRLADAVAASKVYLCGETETPPNTKIARASVGTDKWVPWEYSKSSVEAIRKVRREESKCRVIAIEQHTKAIDYRQAQLELPIALVVGHETKGVSKEALRLVDQIAEIPMFGVNMSLNVMVSLAIILYKAI